jgi:lipopolysaccharide biosynthesis regulator YciM
MELQQQFDNAVLDFSRADFDRAIAKLQAVLAADAACFDAQLALGMAHFRRGNFAAAIAAGHRAEQMNPGEPLVHTNLSLFYMKAGDIAKAEHHGLQARIAGWRAENAAASAGKPNENAPSAVAPVRPKVKVIRMPG